MDTKNLKLMSELLGTISMLLACLFRRRVSIELADLIIQVLGAQLILIPGSIFAIIHQMDTRPEEIEEIEPHQIRITSHGKMHAWVEFALNHFKVSFKLTSPLAWLGFEQFIVAQNSNIPLSLHTLPASKAAILEPPNATQLPNCDTNERSISMSTSTIPRLISVVEIIKREYLNKSDMGLLSGLHQYNEVGHFDQPGVATTNEGRAQTLATALEGKH